MTKQQAIWTLIDCRRLLIDGLVSVQAEEITEAFDMAIEALNIVMDSENDTVESKNDVIKRQDAVSEIDEWIQRATDNETDMAIKEFLSFLKERIDTLPSAEPKTGKWVLDPNGMDWNIPAWRCSECGFVANYIGVEANGLGNNPLNWAGSKFCPQCGARITGYER